MHTDLSKALLLFIDDDRLQRKLFPEVLEPLGAEILTAANAENAMDILSDRRPGLILCDAVMPVTDGFQFCRRLKDDPATRDLPFAIITSLSRNVTERSLEAGADDCFLKRGSEDLLRLRVRELLGIAGGGFGISEPLEAFAGARVVAASDSPLLLSQISLQVAPAGIHLDTCATAGELLDRLDGPPPALLVVDASLSNGQLREIIASVRSQPTWAGVPILAVVDKGEEPEPGIPVDDWITKPLDGREARRRITMGLRFGKAGARR
ncbi:response regulator [Mesoterricola silvestris]|uniref:Response regulatory domain-containing protein n=1 Tax=Mesoterricola silvestris TaxID=2927979 RepID=A0AA48GIJ6_9BACT|nr:response regulator [Mesoterricola silvestris]BDU73601.1 hypothetical protein METEAL_27750 [Mesoterricola silvestris]